MASPKPKPAALKLLEGRGNGRDSGGRPVKAPPAFRRLAPTMPKDLSPIAKQWWLDTVPGLEKLQIVKPEDGPALTMAAEAYAAWSAAIAVVRAEGVLAQNSQGLVRNPALTAAQEASREYGRWCSEFGLTPSSEMKVARSKEDDGKQENPFAGLG